MENKSRTKYALKISNILIVLLLLQVTNLKCYALKEKWVLVDPVIVKNQNDDQKLSITFSKAFKNYTDSLHILRSPNSITLDSLAMLKHIDREFLSSADELGTGILAAFLVGPNEIEANLFKYSLDSNKLIGYSKNYLPKQNPNSEHELLKNVIVEIKKMDISSEISFEAESQFESLLAESESRIIENENKKRQNEIKFKDYDKNKIHNSNELKFAIERIDYYLTTLEKEYPFKKYPNNISLPLIDDKVYLKGLQEEFPHTYSLLLATNALNDYLHLKYQKTKPSDLQIRKDSLDRMVEKLDSIFDNKLVSAAEQSIWKGLNKSMIVEVFALVKIIKKEVEACNDFIMQQGQVLLNSDVTLRIRHTLRLLRERCGSSSSKDVATQINEKYHNWFAAMLRLDTITKFRLEYLKLANDNHIDLWMLKPDIKKTELVTKERIEKYLSNNIEKYMKNAENELSIIYHVSIQDKTLEVSFEIKKNTGKFASALKCFPLGESTFLGIENYYEFVSQSLMDLQRLLRIKLEAVAIIGGSDAAPFSSNYELKIESEIMYQENFEVLPQANLIDLKKLDLKRNSDDKNIALAFKRGFYLKDYLIKNGVSKHAFEPIKVAFFSEGGTNSSFRKCDIRISFHLN